MGMVGSTRHTMSRLLSPIWRRVRLVVSRGVLRLVDDSLKMQGVQVRLLGTTTAEAERFQEYGFSSVPLQGAEAILVSVGGSRGHLVAVAVDDRRHRPRDLQAGESIMYTDEGDRVHMKRGRVIEVIAGNRLDVTAPEVHVTASSKVTLDTPQTEISGDVQIAGGLQVQQDASFAADVTVVGGVTAGAVSTVGGGNIAASGDLSDSEGSVGDLRADHNALKQAYNAHRHTDSEGGTTSPPDEQV